MFAERLETLSPSPALAIQAKAKAMRAAGIREGLARIETAVRSLGG